MRIESEVSWDRLLDDNEWYPARLMGAAATSVMEKMAGTIKPGKYYIIRPYEETRFDEPRFCYRYDFGIDVSEVVRCRDCRYGRAGEALMGGEWKFGDCTNPRFSGGKHTLDVRSDGFCSWAERRD